MKKLLTFAHLWILVLPWFLSFTGALSNQLVLAANHDRFPVLLNEHKLRDFENAESERNEIRDIRSLLGDSVQQLDDGMLDDVHCVMTDQTHLNFLADWIDLHTETCSPGDLLLNIGDYLGTYSFWVWFALVLSDIQRKNADLETEYR